MKNIDKTMKRLRTIIKDKNCYNMNLSNIKGYLGELLVAKKLINEGQEIIQKGNQSRYDISLPNKDIKIDVKFSTIKTEVKGCPHYWGWALKFKRKNDTKKINANKDASCTHFVCVAVDKYLKPYNYYIIKSCDLSKFSGSVIGQFRNVEKSFAILQNPKQISNNENINLVKYFKKCGKLLTDGTVIKIGAKNKLTNKF
jgi:hypothetical protein